MNFPFISISIYLQAVEQQRHLNPKLLGWLFESSIIMPFHLDSYEDIKLPIKNCIDPVYFFLFCMFIIVLFYQSIFIVANSAMTSSVSSKPTT